MSACAIGALYLYLFGAAIMWGALPRLVTSGPPIPTIGRILGAVFWPFFALVAIVWTWCEIIVGADR